MPNTKVRDRVILKTPHIDSQAQENNPYLRPQTKIQMSG